MSSLHDKMKKTDSKQFDSNPNKFRTSGGGIATVGTDQIRWSNGDISKNPTQKTINERTKPK